MRITQWVVALLAVVLMGCSVLPTASALAPIASLSDALPVNRTGVDWFVALEYNPSSGGTAFSGIKSLLLDAAVSLFRGVSAASPQRMGVIFNGQVVQPLSNNLQNVITAISYDLSLSLSLPNCAALRSGSLCFVCCAPQRSVCAELVHPELRAGSAASQSAVFLQLEYFADRKQRQSHHSRH
jgi:hypothetical protein